MSLKAIETIYNGYRFRSRLEARWAVFLDNLSIPYLYEFEGFQTDYGGYLPDFLIPRVGLKPYFIEVKGFMGQIDDSDIKKWMQVASGHQTELVILVGRIDAEPDGKQSRYMVISPEPRLYRTAFRECPQCSKVVFGSVCVRCGAGSVVSKNIATAVGAARSARFEFGQAPKGKAA